MKLTRPICFFDLETTGTSLSDDGIVEISILKYFPDQSREIKTRRINPGKPIPKEASDVHGITDADVKDCPTFKQVASGIIEFIKDCDLGGFNSNSFDIPFLYNEFHRAGINWDYSGVNFIDACTIFKRKEERTLSAACKFYLGQELDNAHSAEADIKATLDVFLAQLDRYDLPESLEEIALYCNYDKTRLDLSGCFSLNEAGEVILTFGKHKGKLASEVKDYLQWMLSSSFLPDTKNIANRILMGVHPVPERSVATGAQ